MHATGRPPSLSKRYVIKHPILDASDEAIMTEDASKIQEGLNEFGYNKEGKVYRATVVRAFFFLSFIYEDILEISLGNSPVDYDRVRQVLFCHLIL